MRAETADGPERTCIITRAKGAPDDMIRFVVGPQAEVVPDIRRKLPGRGVYVTASAKAVAEAVRKRAFSRGFKAQVTVSETLEAQIAVLLEQDCLQALSLANKAGLVVCGFGKVETLLASGEPAGLIHACDGGEDGRRKLGQSLHRRFGQEFAIPQIKLFTSAQLDLALGRTNVIHAALAMGPASEAFLKRCQRLERYRMDAIADGISEASLETAPDGMFEELSNEAMASDKALNEGVEPNQQT